MILDKFRWGGSCGKNHASYACEHSLIFAMTSWLLHNESVPYRSIPESQAAALTRTTFMRSHVLKGLPGVVCIEYYCTGSIKEGAEEGVPAIEHTDGALEVTGVEGELVRVK
jgi:hypothetical protein